MKIETRDNKNPQKSLMGAILRGVGNFPRGGDEFSEGNFSWGQSSREQFSREQFSGGIFPAGIFPRTIVFILK